MNISLQSYKKVCKLRAIGALKMTNGVCNTLSEPRKAIKDGKTAKEATMMIFGFHVFLSADFRVYIFRLTKKQPAHPAHLARENVSTQCEAMLLLRQLGVGWLWGGSCKVSATCGIK